MFCFLSSKDRFFLRPRSFFFNDTATTEIYTLSLHDALPIHSIMSLQSGFLLLNFLTLVLEWIALSKSIFSFTIYFPTHPPEGSRVNVNIKQGRKKEIKNVFKFFRRHNGLMLVFFR